MPEVISAFRSLSLREGQAALDAGKSSTPPRKRRPSKRRVHLTNNHYVCQSCWEFWPELSVTGNEKKVFFLKQMPRPKDCKNFGVPCESYFTHRGGCGGRVSRYCDLSRDHLLTFIEQKMLDASADAKYRTFFPAMGDLVREGMVDADEHHNLSCTGACCLPRPAACTTVEDAHMAHAPAPEASVEFVVARGALRGWEEQGAKTCAAASIAGAINALFSAVAPSAPASEPAGTQGDSGESSQNAESDQSAGTARVPEQVFCRVQEQDVMDYYIQWARDTRRAACTAALRGSCGLAPSTRKIGNPRLLAAGHAVARAVTRGEVRSAGSQQRRGSGGSPPAGEASESEEGSDEDEGEDEPSPIETGRLLGNVACRDTIAEGGRCAPADGEEAVARQWAMLKDALAAGDAVLLHWRNHYALAFATREWVCAATGAVRRQVLTATTRQRPHVWFCFRQLRADIVFSTTNQALLLRRAAGAVHA